MADQTRARLIDAAIERMANAGPAVKVDAIASDVGLTKGALYHHFGSVDGLVEAVYKEAIARHAKLVIDASRAGTGKERLLRMVRESAALLGSGSPFYMLLLRLHVEAGVTRQHLAPIARRVQRRQREYIRDLVAAGQQDGSIRRDVDAAAVGRMTNATLQGMLVQQLESPGEQRRAATEFADLLDVLL